MRDSMPFPWIPDAPDEPLAYTMDVHGRAAWGFAFVVPSREVLERWAHGLQRFEEVRRLAPDVQGIALGAWANEIRLSRYPSWWRDADHEGPIAAPRPPQEVVTAIHAVGFVGGSDCGARALLTALEPDRLQVPRMSEGIVRGTPRADPWIEFLLQTEEGETLVAARIESLQVLRGLVRTASVEAHPAALARVRTSDADAAAHEFCRTPLPRFAAWTPDDLAPWCAHASPEVRAHAVLVAGAIRGPATAPPPRRSPGG